MMGDCAARRAAERPYLRHLEIASKHEEAFDEAVEEPVDFQESIVGCLNEQSAWSVLLRLSASPAASTLPTGGRNLHRMEDPCTPVISCLSNRFC